MRELILFAALSGCAYGAPIPPADSFDDSGQAVAPAEDAGLAEASAETDAVAPEVGDEPAYVYPTDQLDALTCIPRGPDGEHTVCLRNHFNCGMTPDGCSGGMLQCGVCDDSQRCVNNVCVP
jgi:hypothetical protein